MFLPFLLYVELGQTDKAYDILITSYWLTVISGFGGLEITMIELKKLSNSFRNSGNLWRLEVGNDRFLPQR